MTLIVEIVWEDNDKAQIREILKRLKNNKIGGLNGETNEMYKYGINTGLPKIIANLFESIIRGGYCPVL